MSKPVPDSLDMRISQSDLARMTGFSKATVCKALRGSREISETTREKILDCARSQGYRPDPVLSSIAAKRWANHKVEQGATIGTIVQRRHPGLGALDRLLRGIKERAQNLGYREYTFYLEDYPAPYALNHILVSRGIQRLVVTPFYHQQPELHLEWDKFCLVNAALGPQSPHLHTVCVDHFAMIQVACEHLRNAGYHRIGLALFHHPVAIEDDLRRKAAWLLQQGSDVQIPICFYQLDEAENFAEWFQQWKPDAVLGFNGYVLFLLQKYLGPDVLEKIGFATLHKYESDQELSGLVAMEVQVGAGAVDLLQLLYHSGNWGLARQRITHLIEPMWKDGATCRKACMAEYGSAASDALQALNRVI